MKYILYLVNVTALQKLRMLNQILAKDICLRKDLIEEVEIITIKLLCV